MGLAGQATAQTGEPIKIGFGMALTGGLASIGKAALLSMQIWAEDQNAKGGLLGRPVRLIFYDDQSSPSTVPGIYSKLIDVDKVDLVVSGYATNMIAPAMPIIIQKNKVFFALFGLAVNEKFNYPKYFSMLPMGPNPKVTFSDEFFKLAAGLNPKPMTVALVGADAEYPHVALEGARANAAKAGIKIVYDKTYPPATTDYSPIVRAIQATNPDVVFVASYPPDSVGMVRAAGEVGLKTRLFGGGMVGLQSTAIKTQLGPLLNGIVNYDFWLPIETMNFPGVHALLAKYQAKAASEGVDVLGYYLPPWAYANLQVVGQAVEGTKSLDHDKLAAYVAQATFKTIVGDVKYGKGGEWSEARVLLVQFKDIKAGDVEQFRGMATQSVLAPAQYKTGSVKEPYTDAKK
ncbi:MAG: branched-chain amino acid ABC transporter substrate-binding protein [Alphaproteobacteria bacterium]|nr:branched-chain amino acid ABC transporter substrate-binding protein [Alphaproteobacteria bacterium]